MIWRFASFRPVFAVSYRHLRQLLPYSCTVLAGRAVVAADSLLPRLFIGYALGPGPLGQYMVARKLAELIAQLLSKPLLRVSLSEFAAAAGSAHLSAFLNRAIVVTTAAAWPAFLGLGLVAPDFVRLSLGKAWLPTIQLIQILALWGMMIPVGRLYAVLLQGVGRPGVQVAVDASGLALLLLLIGTTLHSQVAIVTALVVARAYVILPLHFLLVAKATRLQVVRPLVKAAPILVASFVMAAAVLGFRVTFSPDLDVMPLLMVSIAVGAMT